ncbi:MAG TPA: hypothetical protein VM935_05730, partial [Chitinophagaceae bacterium]|nr:hypothetical protein [Chitinophagaceae bacterium]
MATTTIFSGKKQPVSKPLSSSDASNALRDACKLKPGGSQFSNMALAHYKEEEYALAAEAYQQALEFEPDNPEWKEMLSLARANAHAEAHVVVPEIKYFDHEALLKKPVVLKGSLPSTPCSQPDHSFGKSLRNVSGNVVGILSSAVMGGVTKLWGGMAGYRDTVWTNWYRRPLFLSILTLAYM